MRGASVVVGILDVIDASDVVGTSEVVAKDLLDTSDVESTSDAVGASDVVGTWDVDDASSCGTEVDWRSVDVGTITTGVEVSGSTKSELWVCGTSSTVVWLDQGCCRLFKRLYRRAVRLSLLPKTSSTKGSTNV